MTKLNQKDFEKRVAEVLHEKMLVEKHQKKEMIARLMIADYLEQAKTDRLPCGKYSVSRISRYIFKDVPIAVAKALHATKDALDTVKLSRLASEGVKITGLSSTQYVVIKETKGDE